MLGHFPCQNLFISRLFCHVLFKTGLRQLQRICQSVISCGQRRVFLPAALKLTEIFLGLLSLIFKLPCQNVSIRKSCKSSVLKLRRYGIYLLFCFFYKSCRKLLFVFQQLSPFIKLRHPVAAAGKLLLRYRILSLRRRRWVLCAPAYRARAALFKRRCYHALQPGKKLFPLSVVFLLHFQ